MVTLRYDEGTVRIDGDGTERLASLSFVEADPRSESHRAPAFRYPFLRRTCRDRGLAVEDRVLDTPAVDGLSTTYELRGYQREALDAWRSHGDRGVVVLPTGSGKTVLAVGAIAALETPTLVVVPTVDLLDQWHEELSAEFGDATAVGRLGGGVQRIEPLTVATYDSAYLRAEDLGNRFGLVVFDEVHHLGGEGYRDAARLSAAPARLGLTATFERPDGEHEVIETLVGPVVYERSAEDLAGDHLADYDIRRLEVPLTPEERDIYERHQQTFTEYLASSDIQLRSGSDYQELVKRSGSDPKAREALLAKQRAREVMMNAERKLTVLADILDRHDGDRVIVFTAYTDLVYDIAERFLIPPITSEMGTDERREILDRFRRGDYSRVVAANVLDEGVDVPDANVAVVLSGSGSQREFTQRLGRVLRPSDDGGRALLYEVVAEETAEERVARRRR
ncbi:DNA repair helicase Rad25 [Natronomonas pharaonis DSM 2160]|uniref:DNA repair helicase Rad25 n=1 Tax=Natronomonas pharaonis (strain ATCC 35678 / DSM 2160 / CIP 103997 / JCM 8858 / NBRC 14720 / NCIMB 2260 / Gabara) TaxID=348780 RepID=A0A1U7ETH5_NATPD|nr:DEAD/DEAH box helicase family protein [Natronomonas pharaonis]CAI48197.1 DNA repair helicase Rad25 [Natronomonas pharaonis DSM 2160]